MGPLVTIKLDDDEARGIGIGLRVFVLLVARRRWAQLFSPATLHRTRMPRSTFERFALEARGCRPTRVASIIRRNLTIAKRIELARFNRARPWARAAITKLEANRAMAK